ncbi:MAG: hypothetical protein ACRDZX_02745 [Acidimicrobiales bacterium]
MTNPLGAQPTVAGVHVRYKRLGRRRRMVEKALAALVLLAAFVVTVVLLGLQWLGNQGTPSSAAPASPVQAPAFTSEVQPS